MEERERAGILEKEGIALHCSCESYKDAVCKCAAMLIEGGYVGERYLEGMLKREESFSTAIGNLLAIPHGEMEYKEEILRTGMVVCVYPEGIDWKGEPVKLVIGIAAKGEEHMDILERIAQVFEEEKAVEAIASNATAEEIHALLTGGTGL